MIFLLTFDSESINLLKKGGKRSEKAKVLKNMKSRNKIILFAGIVVCAFLFFQANRVFSQGNLVTNGDFEEPLVESSQKWEIFSSDEVPGWVVEWAGEYSGAPETANLELHRGVLMEAYSNDQSAELDTDWTSANGEQASVRIYQDIETCEGGEYTLSYAWSPRPNHADNEIEVYWGEDVLASHSGSDAGWTVETFTGLTAEADLTRLAFVETGNPDSLGMFLDAVSVEQTKDCIVREGEITSPEEGESVLGLTTFMAYLVDDDYDPVQWAVRQGTCAAGQGTVFGNVDGYNNEYDWTYDEENYIHNFSAMADTCEWEPGTYCFVFNPKEDSGESDIRLTREFTVSSCDEDGDGIDNDQDMCDGTTADEPTKRLGTNRWIWDGEDWITEKPKGKGKGPDKDFTIEETRGCSCEQILDWLHENYPEEFGEMEGHYKFGCSISIMQEFVSLDPSGECIPGDTQACDTGEPGICAAGTQVCGEDSYWGECEAENEPQTESLLLPETCGDGDDNDCDGLTDNDDPDCQGIGPS